MGDFKVALKGAEGHTWASMKMQPFLSRTLHGPDKPKTRSTCKGQQVLVTKAFGISAVVQ